MMATYHSRCSPNEFARGASEPIPKSGTLREGIAGVERQMIEPALVEFEGNKSRMARHLSISRWTLQQKLKQYGIN